MRHRTRVYPSSAISLSKSATADLDAQARNPYSRSWLWIPGSLVSLTPRNDDDNSLPINGLGIEQPVRIHKRQSRPALAFRHRAVEARAPAGVARRPGLLDADPDRVLIAIHPHLDDTLDM